MGRGEGILAYVIRGKRQIEERESKLITGGMMGRAGEELGEKERAYLEGEKGKHELKPVRGGAVRGKGMGRGEKRTPKKSVGRRQDGEGRV